MTDRGMRSARRRLVLGAIILATATAGMTGVATNALFTDSAAVTTGAFTPGTVSLTAVPVTTVLSMSGMAPGDMVTRAFTVTNDGTLAQRYSVVSDTDEDTLAAQLDFTIKTGVDTCTDGGFAATGTAIYGPDNLGSMTGTNVIGNPLQGSQTGDRTLPASGSEVLCAQVVLPTSTDNTFQTLSTTATLTFNAEQTVNN